LVFKLTLGSSKEQEVVAEIPCTNLVLPSNAFKAVVVKEREEEISQN